MATPLSGSVADTGIGSIDRLLHGSSWNLSADRTLTYSLHVAVDNSVWTTKEILAVRRAFDAWEAVANIRFERVGGPPNDDPIGTSADIAISFTGFDLANLVDYGTLGLAVFPSPSFVNNAFLPALSSIFGVPVTRTDYPQPEGDIFIDDFNYTHWYQSLDDGGQGFHTLIHEIGHALGLTHPRNNGELSNQLETAMSYKDIGEWLDGYSPPFEGHAATPMPYDILAIQHIYGPNMQHRAGNDTYIIRNDGALRTVWDSGGDDKFDAGHLSGGVYIDLYSNLASGNMAGAGVGAYSATMIAFNVTIENAEGGSGADLIIGNRVGNHLLGGGGDDEIGGLAGNDRLIGSGGVDVLDGGTGDDYLSGGSGSDELYGRSGDDRLIGGPGHDVYVINGAAEIDRRLADDGIDTVKSTLSYTLGAQQENLVLVGGGANVGKGNASANLLIGSTVDNKLVGKGGADELRGLSGNDILIGGVGEDLLRGGAGEDVFVFKGTLSVIGIDSIIDFEPGQDLLRLHAATFTGLGNVPIAVFESNQVGAATAPETRIVYNEQDGSLYYDPDGSGAESATHFALLAGAPLITASDILIVG